MSLSQFLCNAVDLVQTATADLHVDGGGHSGIQNGIDHGTAGEKGANIGILALHFFLHPIHVVKAAFLVLFI